MSKVQRALTWLQTAVGAISLKARFTQAADPEQTVCLTVALAALLRDGAWTDRQAEHTDRLKVLGKRTQHRTMGQIPPGGFGFWAHLALCYSFNVSKPGNPESHRSVCVLKSPIY